MLVNMQKELTVERDETVVSADINVEDANDIYYLWRKQFHENGKTFKK